MLWILLIYILIVICLGVWHLRGVGADRGTMPFALILILNLGLGFVLYQCAKSSQGGDKMVLNGAVIDKKKVKVSCSHSYSCMCVTINKVTTCQTCYRHSHDFDWKVYSTVGNVEIDRVNSQGDEEPPRWTAVKVGEPFSISRDYYNYIKASPHSVFGDYDNYKDVKIPKMPEVYDYYRVSHVIDWDSEYKSGIKSFDKLLSEKLATASGKAKANVILVFYSGDSSKMQAFKVKSFGGRINDVIIGINADKAGNIRSVSSTSWSKSSLVDVKIRDSILDLGNLNGENQKKLVDNVGSILVEYYQHRDNEEFKYLEANVSIPVWYYIVLMIMGVATNFALIFVKGEL